MTTGKAEENFVSVNKLRLHYLDWGSVGKPPLVCLHGHGGQAHIWDEFAQAMLPYYHVYALDQRGHGESEWASGGYERDLFVEDLATFVDALALLRVTLVGLSMGGWNAMLYAPNHQDRVERIILVDIGPEPSQASRQMMSSRLPMPLQFDSFEEAITWARQGDPWATAARLRRDLGDRIRQQEDGNWVWKADPALFDTGRGDAWSPELVARYWRGLQAITCPILIVRGKESSLVSDEIVERMRKANRLLSAVEVGGAGHVVPVDKPEEFIAVTRNFLGVPD